jgi:hypothetical protein
MTERRPWTRSSVNDAVHHALAEGLSGSELWSLLLDVFERRAGARTPSTLLEQWSRDTFVRPAPVDQRTLVRIDHELLAAADRFEALELSPLAPLGVCAIVSPTNQNKIVSALRGTEVVSDPTNVLALECATRLRARPGAVVRLATSQRVVRAQALAKRPGFTQHFQLFCLATAGRERRDHAFVVEALVEHVTVLLDAFDRLERDGYAFPNRALRVLARPDRAALGDRIAGAIGRIAVERAVLEHPYYSSGLRFMLFTKSAGGDEVPLADGGAFDWVQKLTSNRKLAFVASGLGAQLVPLLFRRAPAT